MFKTSCKRNSNPHWISYKISLVGSYVGSSYSQCKHINQHVYILFHENRGTYCVMCDAIIRSMDALFSTMKFVWMNLKLLAIQPTIDLIAYIPCHSTRTPFIPKSLVSSHAKFPFGGIFHYEIIFTLHEIVEWSYNSSIEQSKHMCH